MYTGKIKSIGKYKLNASADAPDFRDWQYQPALIKLETTVSKPRGLKILDQEDEGACTGFALAAVINVLRKRSGRSDQVSPRMLYEMAKRHDEWRGFRYEGSSCRGAITGWYNMGVCTDDIWPYETGNPKYLTVDAAKDARNNTLGAYYRLGTRLSDYHAALNEVGVIYCSADIHDGWEEPTGRSGKITLHRNATGGHAFAIVGYNGDGFWIQNSWGQEWGNNGTGLWLYEDWQQNISDAWVLHLALETPQVWHLPREGGSAAGRVEGLFRNTPTRGEIAGHFVHVDDGNYHDRGRYWSNSDDVGQTAELLAGSDKYDHLLLYAHGGLNSVTASARRIATMKETFKSNRIYPFHFMYDTGLLEELKDLVISKSKGVSERAGGLTDWTNKILEHVMRIPGRSIWREMKAGAEISFASTGAGKDVLNAFLAAQDARNRSIKIHLVGHSTGAILHAYLLRALLDLQPDLRVNSVGLLAPAATNALFESHYRALLTATPSQAGIDRMTVYNLSDKLELDDNVAVIYTKSLLYLVSRAFEENPRPASMLGMQKYNERLTIGLRRLKIKYSDGSSGKGAASESHDGFDNDADTMNSVMRQILRRAPDHLFTKQTLKY